MPNHLAGLIDRFRGVRVLVVGDVILDGWLSGPEYRLCREGPVPAVRVTSVDRTPGGAANAAANLAALGARADLVAVTGADAEAGTLRDALRRAGVDPEHVIADPGRRTATKQRLVAAGQLVARLDQGGTDPVTGPVAADLAHRVVALAAEADALLICDYAGGLFAPEVHAAVRRAAGAVDGPVVLDAHDPSGWADLHPDAVTPSWEEARRLAPLGGGPLTGPRDAGLPDASPRVTGDAVDGQAADRAALIVRNAAELHRASGAPLVAVTLDADGSVLLSRGGRPHRTYAVPQPANQTAGAGDSYAAAFVLALASGATPDQAADLGQAAASVVARGTGTAVCTDTELRAAVSDSTTAFVRAEELARLVGGHRAAGRRIVFTNGCFDVLHRGHVDYLEQARRLGDVLVVALNSDASVARLKGPGRPVNPVEDRAAVLAGLTSVDHVVVFDEDTPRRLLDVVRPEVYVKGGDYRPEMIPEATQVRRLGGRVQIIDYLSDRSTSAIIDRIRRS